MSANKLTHRETAIEPHLPIVDPHHHLWDTEVDSMGWVYYNTDELITDIQGGHNVVGSVYLECTSHYRESGDPLYRPVGETEWVASLDVPAGIMGGIIGFADVRLGADVRPILQAHRDAGDGRFKGIRYSAAWDADPDVTNTGRDAPPGTLRSAGFQRGVREVGAAGLVFETWAYFHQLDDVLALARSAPETTIVLDHLGGPAGAGVYAGHREEVRSEWQKGITALAGADNVVLKLGGLGFAPFLDPEAMPNLTSSERIAEYWQPELEFAVEAFGADRCMYESNFPVDSFLCDYVTLWNAFKHVSVGLSSTERESLFSQTAERVYWLDLPSSSS